MGWAHLHEDFTVYEAVLFEAAQGLGEHLLRDAGHGAAELPEPVRFFFELADDQGRPLRCNEVEDVPTRTPDRSGAYFDNDARRFADPHPDALDPAKNAAVVQAIETIIAAHH